MLNHLRAKAEQAFSAARSVILASSGPAGLQADSVLCRSEGLCLYLLVPRTSDQLLNLEVKLGQVNDAYVAPRPGVLIIQKRIKDLTAD